MFAFPSFMELSLSLWMQWRVPVISRSLRFKCSAAWRPENHSHSAGFQISSCMKQSWFSLSLLFCIADDDETTVVWCFSWETFDLNCETIYLRRLFLLNFKHGGSAAQVEMPKNWSSQVATWDCLQKPINQCKLEQKNMFTVQLSASRYKTKGLWYLQIIFFISEQLSDFFLNSSHF